MPCEEAMLLGVYHSYWNQYRLCERCFEIQVFSPSAQEWVKKPRLEFICAVLNNGDLPDKTWRTLWDVAQGIGLGAQRHLGYGQFRVMTLDEIADYEEISGPDGTIEKKPRSVADLLEMKAMVGTTPANGAKTEEAAKAPAKTLAAAGSKK